MDWWKGNHAVSKMNNEAPSKTTRKYTKNKTKADIGPTVGQSTMLAFVENKESKSMLVDPPEVSTSSSVFASSPAPSDTTPLCIHPCQACDSQEQGNNIKQFERDDLPTTPSVKRISVNEGLSTGSDAENSCTLNKLSIPEQESSDHAPQVLSHCRLVIISGLAHLFGFLNYDLMALLQVEPTRRSARLKSIQVKQALKDDFISDEEDDFRPRKVRSKETPISKGLLQPVFKEISIGSLRRSMLIFVLATKL
jgi:hypothetical protein